MAEVAGAWADLPAAVKAGIVATVRAVAGGEPAAAARLSGGRMAVN